MTKKAAARRIISASRRTDLVACWPRELAAILSGERGGALAHLRPEQVHSLVLWTKDFRPLLDEARLREAARACDQVICQLTITGMGGSPLEPAVPPASELLPRLEELIDFLGTAERLVWRFDPLIRWREWGNADLAPFDSIAERMAALGVRDLRSSWVSPYPKVLRRLPDLVVPSQREMHEALHRLAERAARWGLELRCCCVPGMAATKCIDARRLSELHPRGELISPGKPSQREGCGCDRSWDVGWYHHRCRHGCLYCYGRS